MSKYGFVQIERDFITSIPDPKEPTPLINIELPSSNFAKAALEHVKGELTIETLNHSLRAFLYARAIIHDQFSHWEIDEDVIFVTSLFHDIATTDKNLKGTKLSFEYYGGIIAYDWILKHNDNQEFAEAVAEAIIRHQDLTEKGYITQLGLILQIATVLDNVGFSVVSKLIHPTTLKTVNDKYSRENWSTCFSNVIKKESDLKPWSHSTSLGINSFRSDVLNNNLTYQ